MKKTILAIALLMSISLPVHAGWFSNLFGGEQLGSTINALPVFRVVSDTYAEFRNTAWELGASGSEIVKAWFSEICLGGDCRTSWPAGGGGSIDQLGQIGDVSTSTLAYGHVLTWDGSNWQDNATSTLGIDLSDTTGSITESRISDLGSYLLDSGDTATGNYNFDSGTLYVDASNNRVGIGTASPSQKLHIYANAVTGSDRELLRIENNNGDSVQLGAIAKGITDAGWRTFATDYGTASLSGGSGIYNSSGVGNAAYLGAFNDNTIRFFTGSFGTEIARFTTDGKVGIGTNSPAAKLQLGTNSGVNGGDFYSFNNGNNPRFLFGDTSSAGNWGGLRWDSALDAIQIYTDEAGTDQLVLRESGLVGIATTTPWGQLSVEGQGTAPAFAVSDTSNNTDLIVDSSGDVGVGMTLDIINETNSTQGYITQNGTRLLHTYSSESPSTNLFVGLGAGNFTSSAAIANVGIGETALDALTTGDYNNAVGRVAGSAITSGFNNNAMGNAALAFLNTGSNNNAVGNAALLNITGSSFNVGIGSGAGRGITSGTGNTYIGTYSGYPNDASTGVISGLTNATAIGYNSTVNASNSLILGAVSPFGLVNVGIGTSTPLAKLSIFAASDDTVSNLLTVSSSTTSGEDTHFLIQRSGNVGVSTTTPFTDFSVSGNAVITGSLYDNTFSSGSWGDVLQSTGSGYTWVATSTLGLGGSGGGSVTSVGMSVPTGLTISGSPITSAGTLAVGLDTGYEIPTSTRLVQHDTAYGWGDHSTQGYLTASPFGAAIDPTELASADFGDFTCNGTTCTLDTDYITEAELDTIAELQTQIADATLLISGGTLTTGNLCQYDGTGIDCNLSNTLHAAVTLAGEDYLSLSTQQITANAINPDNLAAADFGDFTCNGTTCSLDVAVGGDTGWSTSTAFGSQVILYPAGTTYDVLFGANSTTTAPFWWDVSATSTYIGNGGSGDSAVQLGDDNNAWTFGKDDTDGSFAIASSTTLGTDNLLTIQKNATTTLQNANGIDFTDGTNGMRIYFGGTTTTLEFY